MPKQYKTAKFDEGSRTFETRVKFIHALFANKYDQNKIMASCVMHKLDASFENYLKEVHRSCWMLWGEDPMTVLKRIDKK